MKIYLKENVYDAALNRIRYLFDEFENVIVGYSGGKDSTVCLELSLIVAAEKNRLPLRVMFLDQETEWEATHDMAREVMYRKEVLPMWFQIPMVISNNTSQYSRFTNCWDEEHPEKWVHPKDPISIKENKYKSLRFHDLFDKILAVDFKDEKACYIAGVRTEEAPKRYVALTYHASYKYITWAKKFSKQREHYTFYPIYDWNTSDVWKAIHDNNWLYNNIYNELYRQGYSIKDMRVSNLHHETALTSLLKVQTIEPQTWVKIAEHVEGANTVKHLKGEAFECPKVLPPMFNDWEEYLLHLVKYLVTDEKNKESILSKLKSGKEGYYNSYLIKNDFINALIRTVMSSDWDFTKYTNWTLKPDVYGYRSYMQGKRNVKMLNDLKFFNAEQIKDLFKCLDIKEYADRTID